MMVGHEWARGEAARAAAAGSPRPAAGHEYEYCHSPRRTAAECPVGHRGSHVSPERIAS
eukprot:gene8839-7826_t